MSFLGTPWPSALPSNKFVSLDDVWCFEIRLHPDAVKFLVDLNPETKERLKSGIKSLETDPFKSRSHSDIKKLKGTKKREELYRLRIGNYRIIYAVEENTVFVLEIIPRKKDITGFESRVSLSELRFGSTRSISASGAPREYAQNCASGVHGPFRSLRSLKRTTFFQNFHKQETVREKLKQQQKEVCRHHSIFPAEIEFVFWAE